MRKSKICQLCGKEFIPESNPQRYCKNKHYSICEICGKPFEITWQTKDKKCCSKECTQQLRQRTMVDRFGVPFSMQNEELKKKSEETSLKKFGVKHAAQSQEIKDKTKEKFREKYGVDWPVEAEWFQEKSKETCLKKYGVEYTSQIPGRTEKMQQTNLEKYRGIAPICNRDIRMRSNSHRGNASKLEIRLHNFLNEYNIQYIEEYVIQGDNFTHSFDVFLPEYNILIDCDGMFYHGYLDDPDGQWILPDNDSRRLELIPEGTRFLIIVEDDFERGLKQLQRMLNVDVGIYEYEGDIFKWCRSVDFPYPQYEDKRLKKEFSKLSNLDVEILPKGNWFGISIVRQFHKSIWNCNVKGYISPYEAWYDDSLLKKVIANRLIYIDNLNPSNVLRGFNVSKIAPRVSLFNPVLARYLINKYLNNYDQVFDPFSGFSGRLLGATSLGKLYIGQDIREESVKESNDIIEFFNLDAYISTENILNSSGEYDCLFTCPPYKNQEIYIDSQHEKACDNWIDICLNNFKCNKYLFVVNETSKYQDKIVEELPVQSHFRSNKEYVILI